MNEISKLRFDALASYARNPLAALLAKELRWFEFNDERLLAVVLLDTDGEYSAVFMAKDMRERYRWVDQTPFFSSIDEALASVPEKAERILSDLEEQRKQGDDESAPVDFFEPVHGPERLNPAFVQLANQESLSPAREIIRPMMRWYEDIDGNFIEQFQTTGFHQRIWELYLFAAFNEVGSVDQEHAVPDFVVQTLEGEFCVEATTVNPSQGAAGMPLPPPPTETPEAERAYTNEWIPIRYAGVLCKKLDKRYWELPHVAEMPVLFAVHDFHASMSMTWSRNGLVRYLYGYDHEPTRAPNGDLVITPTKVETHRWGAKEVQSGFFRLPEAENVSAVIFNSSATISKFNRIGLVAGFGSKRVRLVRAGTKYDPDPNASEPKGFQVEVRQDNYSESWIEGMDVFHNPSAKRPLDPEMLPGAAHHRLRDDGQIKSLIPKWHAYASVTFMFVNGEEQDRQE
ncbi:MAG TPA: hypothetical protein VHJ82_08100 [Actinomycetota bacterium]|nr:hypothetical protein [Actinomycetota bacterium]